MIFKYISLPVFLLSLSIGLLFVYLSEPVLSDVSVFPTPDNLDKVEYKDKADNCYVFEGKIVDCSGKNVVSIPLQN